MNTETIDLLIKIADQLRKEGEVAYSSVREGDSVSEKIGKVAKSNGFDRSAIIVLENIE